MTATRVDSFVTAATNVVFNLQERASATPGTSGSTLLSGNQTAITTGATSTSFADAALAADNWLWLEIVSVSGTPGRVSVTLATTVP
jgi:hypothetical protein